MAKNKITVNVRDKDLNKIIKRLDRKGKVARKRTNKAIIATALNIEGDAKESSDIPVDTGRLRASIHAEYKDSTKYRYSDNEGRSFDGSLDVKPSDLQAYVGSNVQYAPTQEAKNHFLISSYNANIKKLVIALKGIIK